MSSNEDLFKKIFVFQIVTLVLMATSIVLEVVASIVAGWGFEPELAVAITLIIIFGLGLPAVNLILSILATKNTQADFKTFGLIITIFSGILIAIGVYFTIREIIVVFTYETVAVFYLMETVFILVAVVMQILSLTTSIKIISAK